MTDNLSDVYKALTSDEILLRLLYYLPSSPIDDPLSTDKPNILDMENRWDIIRDVIKPIEKTDDLENTPKCRLFVYPGNRNSTGNYLLANQEIVFDILVHIDFQDMDLRLSRICDRINELVCNKKITGIGKVLFDSGGRIGAPANYIAYRLIYVFGSAS
jgi:hypothetical protein